MQQVYIAYKKIVAPLSFLLFLKFTIKAKKIERYILYAYKAKERGKSSKAEILVWKALHFIPQNACFPKLDMSYAIKNNKVYYEPNKPESGKTTFYKARTLPKGAQTIGNQDMSYIPLDKKFLARDERFSHNHSPCLYLANSTEVCLKELVKSLDPDQCYLELPKYCFSCFDITTLKNCKILDLTYNLAFVDFFFEDANSKIKKGDGKIKDLRVANNGGAEFNGCGNQDWKQLINYFYIRIIVIATSFVSKEDNKGESNPKSEYVISQLILDKLIKEEKDILGIAYISTQISTYSSNRRAINLAFPAKENGHRYNVVNSDGLSFSYVFLNKLDGISLKKPCHYSHFFSECYPLESLVHLQNFDTSVNLTYDDRAFAIEDVCFYLDDYLVNKANLNLQLSLNG